MAVLKVGRDGDGDSEKGAYNVGLDAHRKFDYQPSSEAHGTALS